MSGSYQGGSGGNAALLPDLDRTHAKWYWPLAQWWRIPDVLAAHNRSRARFSAACLWPAGQQLQHFQAATRRTQGAQMVGGNGGASGPRVAAVLVSGVGE